MILATTVKSHMKPRDCLYVIKGVFDSNNLIWKTRLPALTDLDTSIYLNETLISVIIKSRDYRSRLLRAIIELTYIFDDKIIGTA